MILSVLTMEWQARCTLAGLAAVFLFIHKGNCVALYHMAPSPAARSVDLLLHSMVPPLAVEYRTVDLMKNEQLKPEYLKVNPVHTIPAIDDDGFILWESRAIMTYLVSKYAADDALYPKDLKKRAIVDQRLHFSNDLFFMLKFTARHLMAHNLTAVPDAMLDKMGQIQKSVEKLLSSGQKFMAADALTVADFSYITLIDPLEVYLPPGDSFPLTKAWKERCMSTMKDFDKVNEPGQGMLLSTIKNILNQ